MFDPDKRWGSFICLFATILLIIVFRFHMEDTAIALFSYLYSTYGLIIFVKWFVKACKSGNDFIKSNSRLYHFYQKRRRAIHKYTLVLGSAFRFIYGIVKLSMGVYYESWWFITLAIYYLMICIMKINLISHFESGPEDQRRKLKHIGIILLFMDIVLVGMIILIVYSHQTFYYAGYLIYAVALYDFYLIITALINVFKYRKNAELIITASRYMNLTIATVSMISLEVAMIYTFGDNDTELKSLMTSLMGIAVTIINSIMAVSLICKGRKNDGSGSDLTDSQSPKGDGRSEP